MKVWIETDDLVTLLNAEKQRDSLQRQIDSLNEVIRNGKTENERLISELNKNKERFNNESHNIKENAQRIIDRLTKERDELSRKVKQNEKS